MRIASLCSGESATMFKNTMFKKTGLAIIGCWLAVSAPFAAGQSCPREPRDFLSQTMGFSAFEIQQVEQGAAVARTLKSEKHEVATLGLVLIRAPREFYVEQFRDIEKLKKSQNVLQVKKLSDPPRLEDFNDVALTSQETHDLQKCRAGQCSFKISAEMIARLHERADQPAADAKAQDASFFRKILLEYIETYLASGNRAMMTYNDKDRPVSTSEEFNGFLDQSPYLSACAPEFSQYLRNFPSQALPSVENFIYWSKENYSQDLKPVLTVTHVSIYQPAVNGEWNHAPGGPFVLASKQIYAAHYYESSLGLTLLLDAQMESGGPAFYMVYVNRSTIDLLRKWYSGLARGRVSSRVRDSMKINMMQLKQRIERLYCGD
ncbi:MAG: hypothetical protein LAP21_17790 [Acidobacteriia bacterium]|nr:hypothetical protein [Terriglobia bacterium]